MLVRSPSFERFNLYRVRLAHIFLELGSQDQSKLLALGTLKNHTHETFRNMGKDGNIIDVGVGNADEDLHEPVGTKTSLGRDGV